MKFNKIYAFIFALTLFFIGNSSVYAYNNTNYTYNYTGTEHWIVTPVVDNDPFIVDVYQKSTGETYTINLGSLTNDGYSNVVDFVAIDVSSTDLRFAVLFGEYTYNDTTTYLSDLINSEPISVIRELTPMYENDTDRMLAWYLDFKDSNETKFSKAFYFKFDTSRYRLTYNTAVDNLPYGYTGGGINIQRSNGTQYAIPYATRNIYNTTNGIPNDFMYYESAFKPIPDIKADVKISYVDNQGDYQASVNIYDTQPGWYYEITDLETGYTTSKVIDSALKVHSTLFMGLTHNKIYYLKIWNNENKDILYYSDSLQAIIDENKPHIVIKTLVENEDGSHTIDYYFKNTTSKNICSYTTADIDWISHDCSLYTEDNVNNFTLVNNGLFGVRIREINTNDIVDEYLFNFVNNSSNPYITFTGSMSTTTRIYTLNYHTFNYLDTDNLYYSKDGINWIYLESFDSSIDFIENNIDVYFKLEDKDGNLKYQIVTKVSYNKDGNYDINSNQDISSMSGKLTQFLKPINYVIDRCVDLYNVLPGKVQDYFFILFLLGIITIVISIIL